MDAKKRKIYVFVVLIAVAIWGYNNIFDDDKEKIVDKEVKAEPAEISSIVPLKTVALDFSEYTSRSWGNDPFFRGKVKRETKKEVDRPDIDWLLGGILYSDKNPAAVINKQIVHQGDMINGALVVEINREVVIMKKDGTNFVLGIKKEKS